MGADGLKKYRNFVFTTKYLLLPIGLWPMKKHRFIQQALSNFCLATLLLMCYTTSNYTYKNISNIKKVTRGFSWFLNLISLILKLRALQSNRDRVMDLNETLVKIFEKDLTTPGLKSLMMKRISTFLSIYYLRGVAVFLAFGSLTIRPLLHKSTGYLTVYPGKYPLDFANHLTTYRVVYLYEISLVFFYGCLSVGVDLIFGLYVFQLIGGLKALGEKLRQLRPGKSYATDLRECLDKYAMLHRCLGHLQKMYGFLIIWLYITISMNVCEYAYKITKTELTVANLQPMFYFLLGFLIKGSQAYAYSYCGCVINEEDEKAYDAIYECHWADSGDKRIAKDVLILLSRRQMEYRPYNFFLVSMNMFANIARAFMSYYCLLKTLEE